MEVLFYIVQHGEAKSKEEDPERHLTEKGKEETRKVAEYLSKKGIKPYLIVHSGKTRAKETAEIFAEYLKPEKGVIEGKNLSPLDSPSYWAKELKKENLSLMLVGHLPHLSELVSLLTAHNSEIEIIKFRYSSCIALSRENGIFRIKWFIIPEII